MNRVKRLGSELLQRYPNKFGTEFEPNKKAVNEVAIVTSKVLRNELAGYITSYLHKQAAQDESAMSSEDVEKQEEAIEQ